MGTKRIKEHARLDIPAFGDRRSGLLAELGPERVHTLLGLLSLADGGAIKDDKKTMAELSERLKVNDYALAERLRALGQFRTHEGDRLVTKETATNSRGQKFTRYRVLASPETGISYEQPFRELAPSAVSGARVPAKISSAQRQIDERLDEAEQKYGSDLRAAMEVWQTAMAELRPSGRVMNSAVLKEMNLILSWLEDYPLEAVLYAINETAGRDLSGANSLSKYATAVLKNWTPDKSDDKGRPIKGNGKRESDAAPAERRSRQKRETRSQSDEYDSEI